MVKTVILDGARTPFGKFGEALSSLRASELGGVAMKEALNRADVDPDEIDEVIFGRWNGVYVKHAICGVQIKLGCTHG